MESPAQPTATKAIDRRPADPGIQRRRRATDKRQRILIAAAVVVMATAIGGAAIYASRAGGTGSSQANRSDTSTSDGSSATGDRAGFGQATASPGPTTSASARPSASPGKPAGPPATSGFPGPANTGVPTGTNLTSYTGSCTIRAANTVIDSKLVNCTLDIRAQNVMIKKSKVIGRVDSNETSSVTIQDSEVDRGTAMEAAVGNSNITIYRSDIHGGETSVNCSHNCLIRDSWLHGQYMPDGANWHLDAFLSNEGGNFSLIHNTLACDHPGSSVGGCSGDAAIFADFAPLAQVTFDNNLFVASRGLSYCLYAGSQDNKPFGTQTKGIVVKNNVFQRGSNNKCGEHGPVANFDSGATGNQWTNNVWDNGQPLKP